MNRRKFLQALGLVAAAPAVLADPPGEPKPKPDCPCKPEPTTNGYWWDGRNNAMYAMGGGHANGQYDRALSFDLETMAWEELPVNQWVRVDG